MPHNQRPCNTMRCLCLRLPPNSRIARKRISGPRTTTEEAAATRTSTTSTNDGDERWVGDTQRKPAKDYRSESERPRCPMDRKDNATYPRHTTGTFPRFPWVGGVPGSNSIKVRSQPHWTVQGRSTAVESKIHALLLSIHSLPCTNVHTYTTTVL